MKVKVGTGGSRSFQRELKRPGVGGRLQAPSGSRAQPCWWPRGRNVVEAPRFCRFLRHFYELFYMQLFLTYYKIDKYTTKTALTFFSCSSNIAFNFGQQEEGEDPPSGPPLNPQVLWAILIQIKFHVDAILSESQKTNNINVTKMFI